MPTNKHLTDLVINKVESQEVYDYMVANNLINDDELYLVGGESAAVLYTPQTLTDVQKEQARANIGAISVADIPEVPVTSVAGKTGAVTLDKSDVGLGNVTNESKATMFTSPAFTGTPTAPTAANTVDNTQIATTAFVHNVVDALEDKDTTYTAGTGLSLSGTQFNHSNAITAGTVQGNSGAVDYEGTITIPKVTYDAQGHITSTDTTTVTLPKKITAADLGLNQAMKFLGTTTTDISDASNIDTIIIGSSTVEVEAGNVVLYNDYEYVWTGSLWEQLGQEGSFALSSIIITAGAGLTGGGDLSANRTIGHSNSVTAGTAQGDASKTLEFGGTFTIPTVTYDAQGHITTKGTTTMTMPAKSEIPTISIVRW